jgi:hypothetical protein
MLKLNIETTVTQLPVSSKPYEPQDPLSFGDHEGIELGILRDQSNDPARHSEHDLEQQQTGFAELRNTLRFIIFLKKLHYLLGLTKTRWPSWIVAVLAAIVIFMPLILFGTHSGYARVAAGVVVGVTWAFYFFIILPVFYFFVRKHWPSDLELSRYLRGRRNLRP